MVVSFWCVAIFLNFYGFEKKPQPTEVGCGSYLQRGFSTSTANRFLSA